jgi:hypothetical protein
MAFPDWFIHTLLKLGLAAVNLRLGVHFQRTEDPQGEITLIGQIVLFDFFFRTESSELVTPLGVDLLSFPAGDAKELLNGFHHGQERLGTTCEQIERNNTFAGPGVEGNV